MTRIKKDSPGTVPISALLREDEVQSKIRKIRAFGRNARVVCSAFFALGLVVCVSLVLVMLFGPLREPRSGNGGVFNILTGLHTPLPLKVWTFILMGVVVGVWLAAVYQLYRLFGNLAAGAIYTPENVSRVRFVGLLWLLWAMLGIVIPATLVVVHRLTDASVPLELDRIAPSFSELLSSFVAAGIVLLVSWIMDVGLFAKEHADALERDANLTI
jgi:hypothetical protein